MHGGGSRNNGRGKQLQRSGAEYGVILCADNSLLDSTQSEWLQGALKFLMEIFYPVGLRMNVGNLVGMVYQPFRTVRSHLEEA